jgi:hypothetical protein
MPRGTGTPALRKISLPWYSWIFMAFLFWNSACGEGLRSTQTVGSTAGNAKTRNCIMVRRVKLALCLRCAWAAASPAFPALNAFLSP